MKAFLLILFVFVSHNILSQKEDFDKFLHKFSYDSAFQVSRVKFPLLNINLNSETLDVDTLNIRPRDYKLTNMQYELLKCTEAYTQVYDNFDCELRDSDERVFRWRGFTGMDERYYFKRLTDGCWYLLKYENLGL